VSNYFKIIGNPVLVPQWAYGWNQCRWGYTHVSDVRAVVDNYKKNDLPLDVAWSDIDYLQDYRDFEFDQDRFKELPTFVEDLHKMNMKYVPIIDAGIAYRPKGNNYKAFEDAFDQGLFVKINNEEIFVG